MQKNIQTTHGGTVGCNKYFFFICWSSKMAALLLLLDHSIAQHYAPLKVTSVLVLFVIFGGLF